MPGGSKVPSVTVDLESKVTNDQGHAEMFKLRDNDHALSCYKLQ